MVDNLTTFVCWLSRKLWESWPTKALRVCSGLQLDVFTFTFNFNFTFTFTFSFTTFRGQNPSPSSVLHLKKSYHTIIIYTVIKHGLESN